MICPNCKATIPDGSHFCNMCGTQVGAAGQAAQAQSMPQQVQPYQQVQQPYQQQPNTQQSQGRQPYQQQPYQQGQQPYQQQPYQQSQQPYQQQPYQQGQQSQQSYQQVQLPYRQQPQYQQPYQVQQMPKPHKKIGAAAIACIAIAAVAALFAIMIFLTPIGYMTGIYNKVSGNWAAGTTWYQVDSYGMMEKVAFTGQNTVKVIIQESSTDSSQDVVLSGTYKLDGDTATITTSYSGETQTGTFTKTESGGTTTLIQQDDNSVWFSDKDTAVSSGYMTVPDADTTV